MDEVLVALRRLEFLDHVLDALGMLFTGHQNGISRFDDDHVLHTNCCNQTVVCPDIGVADVVEMNVALDYIALDVGPGGLP